MVGAVVVKNGRIVGEGYHHKAGLPHAEVNALNDAGKDADGATIYVTLEPCSTYGRTPPCTEAIKKAKIKRVVCASEDFNPKHAGNGFAILRDADIEVEVGICRKEALELNKAFFSHITRKRPYVLLKMAMTLDGRIATHCGDSKWITSAKARQRVQELRRWCDAIMVGGETVRLDHPGLVVRDVNSDFKQPQKLIFTRMSSEQLHNEFFPEDATVRPVAPQNASEWDELLRGLATEGITALLLEGGGELAGTALQAGVVDEVEFHIAPKILTGSNSRPVVGGSDPGKLAEALNLDKLRVCRYGCDLVVSGKLIK
jgi:diaminohydroxyphosphoribosylaminopyrimidine deaminase/5-amino-6-(5-phosphoribosylamino)uracil reductase